MASTRDNALEDVGVANVDLLAQIISSQRNRKWREQAGGDWPVMAELTRQMAISEHCQSACDLLLRAINDPIFDQQRAAALELTPAELSRMLWDGSIALEVRGITALAMGGGLAEGQRHRDPCAVFDILTDAGRSSHVVATCRAAWKLTRNPMGTHPAGTALPSDAVSHLTARIGALLSVLSGAVGGSGRGIFGC